MRVSENKIFRRAIKAGYILGTAGVGYGLYELSDAFKNPEVNSGFVAYYTGVTGLAINFTMFLFDSARRGISNIERQVREARIRNPDFDVTRN